MQGGQEIAFTTEVVKAGRAFNLHRVTASQHAKPVITMTCSFTTDTDGYVRVDDWLLQDVHSLVNAGGRGTLRGVIRDRTGTIVASMAQEMLLQPFPP